MLTMRFDQVRGVEALPELAPDSLALFKKRRAAMTSCPARRNDSRGPNVRLPESNMPSGEKARHAISRCGIPASSLAAAST